MRNIVLVGFMGTGKSAVAGIIAQKTGRRLVEMDEVLEKAEGISINDIFARKGEPYFRACERKLVEELSTQEGLVVSAGGGVVLNEQNILDFESTGTVVCLTALPDAIFSRVRHQGHRPLLKAEDPLARIEQLLEARDPFYKRVRLSVATDGKTPQSVAEEVLTLTGKSDAKRSR